MSEFVGLRIGSIHEEHTVSEYYCGGCGWPVTDHDSYCQECGGRLHGTLEEEAAKMAVRAENDKLRELVEDMAAEIRGLGVDFKRVGWCDYADRMHVLGIEINE